MEEETGPVKLNTVLEGTHSQDSHPEKSVFKCHTFCIAKKKKKKKLVYKNPFYCNYSYSGGKDQEDHSSKPAQQIVSSTLS
jgi:hypothetical protein